MTGVKASRKRRVAVLVFGLVLFALLGQLVFVARRFGAFEPRGAQHEQSVYYLDLSRDGSRLFSIVPQENRLLLRDFGNPFDRWWGTRKSRQLDALRGTMSPDGRFALIVRDDPDSASPLRSINGGFGGPFVAEIFDLDEWRTVRVVEHENLWGMAFAPDGRKVAWFSRSGLHVAELPSGEEVVTRQGFEDKNIATTLAFSNDARQLAFGTYGRVLILDAVSGLEIRCLETRPLDDYPGALVFAPDDRTLADCHYDGVRAIDATTGAERWHTRTRNGSSGGHLAYSPDGRLIFSCEYARGSLPPQAVYALDAFTGKPVGTPWPVPWASVAFASDGSVAAVGSYDGSITVSPVETLLSRFR